jgi:predicted metal-dependent enzyme (double-stranded beta helix superfamily)
MTISTNPALHAVTNAIVNAAKGPHPLEQIQTVLHDITNRFCRLGVLVHEEEDDEVLLHASQNLTIYHITLSPGLQYPPHDHLMDAVIGIYNGGETNFIYPVVAGMLGVPERRDFTAPTLVHLLPQTVHSVANTGSGRSGALHVYLGDLPRACRHLWSLQSNQAEPFDNDRYLAGAQPIQRSISEHKKW